MSSRLEDFNSHWWPGGVLLFLLIFAAYFPALHNGFVWDDDQYLTGNPNLYDGQGLQRIWFDLKASRQYYPLVFTSFWLEYHLWDFHPAGYHFNNLWLHALGTLVLWRILNRLKVPYPWWVAAVFALHPVQVESVAWITERKNVLSGLFYFSSLYCYLRFSKLGADSETASESSTLPRRRWTFYAVSWVLFLGALGSKTVTCSLPAVILLLIWWKHSRIGWRDFLFTGPFFVVGLGMAWITSWLEKTHVGALGPEWDFSWIERFLIAGRALWFYLMKLVWPVPLVFVYPRWSIDAAVWWQYVFPCAFLLLIMVLWGVRGRVGRGPLAAVLFFAGSLFPALGFFNVYPMRYSFVADHFQYLPSIGMIVLLVGLAGRAIEGFPSPIPKILPVAFLLLLGGLSWNQVHHYKDVESLWQHTVKKNPAAWMAHYNLGQELISQGRPNAAIQSYRAAIKHKPDHYKAHYNLGNAYQSIGQPDEAVASYQNTLTVKPDHLNAIINLGITLGEQGKEKAGIVYLQKALTLDPDYANAHYNLGYLYMKTGKPDLALSEFKTVLRLDPNDAAVKDAIRMLENKKSD